MNLQNITDHLTNGEIVEYLLEIIGAEAGQDIFVEEILLAMKDGYISTIKDSLLEQQEENDYLLDKIAAADKENAQIEGWSDPW